MSASAAETIMTALATITLILLVTTCAIWVLAFGARLAGKRTLLFPAATAGRPVKAAHQGVNLALDPYSFLFDRRLPAAAASGARRVARESIVSVDGAITINLTSPSRREIEISLLGSGTPPGTIAVVHVKDESGDRIQLIPLGSGSFEAVPGYPSGIAIVSTNSPAVGISRDVKLLQEAELDTLSPGEIIQSVRSATGPTRRWWQALLSAVDTGQVKLGEQTISAIATAIAKNS